MLLDDFMAEFLFTTPVVKFCEELNGFLGVFKMPERFGLKA